MKVLKKLSPDLVKDLQSEKIVSIFTQDKFGEPHLSTLSWVFANQSGVLIKVAVGHKSLTAYNLEQNDKVILGLIAAGCYYIIKGTASVSDVIEKTIKFKVISIKVESVHDSTFYGGKITVEPQFKKTYNEDLAKTLDEEVYETLKITY